MIERMDAISPPSTLPFPSLPLTPPRPLPGLLETCPKKRITKDPETHREKNGKDVDIIHQQLLLLQRLILRTSSPLSTPNTTLHPLTKLATPPETPNANQIPSILLLSPRRGSRNTTSSLRTRAARALHHRKAQFAEPSIPRLGRYQRGPLAPDTPRNGQQDQAPFNTAVGWSSGSSLPTANRRWSTAIPADVYHLR